MSSSFTIARIIAVCLLLHLCSAYTNTTDFWRNQLNYSSTDMHFQCYAGTFPSHSGYQEIDWYRPYKQSGMFYELFSAMGSDIVADNPNIPLIIWLQGGPGGSSQFGAFTENGPIRIINGKPQLFQHSWSLLGHALYIDQPLNVGFSYYGNRTSTDQVSTAS